MMKTNRQRRLFFKHLAGSTSEFLQRLVLPDHAAASDKAQMSPEIMGDLTPELMALEADRLGLDAEKDRDLVLQSIQAAMKPPENRPG